MQLIAGGMIFLLVGISVSLGLAKQGYTASSGTVTSLSPQFCISTIVACLLLIYIAPRLIFSLLKKELQRGRQHLKGGLFLVAPLVFFRYVLLIFVTLLGFVITLPNPHTGAFIPFAIISLALMIFYFPTSSRVRGWVESLNDIESL